MKYTLKNPADINPTEFCLGGAEIEFVPGSSAFSGWRLFVFDDAGLRGMICDRYLTLAAAKGRFTRTYGPGAIWEEIK